MRNETRKQNIIHVSSDISNHRKKKYNTDLLKLHQGIEKKSFSNVIVFSINLDFS